MTRIAVEGLTVRLGGRTVLDRIGLTVDEGVVCVAGANGSGKTTLLRVLCGLQRHDGRVVVDGSDLRTRAGRRALPARIGYLPQQEHIEPRLSVGEAVAYAAWLHRLRPAERAVSVAAAIDAVGLHEVERQRVGDLSGGTRRRVALAQALVHRPGVLLLDEPTSGLDLAHRAGFRGLVRELGRDRVVVFSSHLVEEIELLPDRVVVLDGGRIAFDGHPAALTALGAPHEGERPLEAALRTLGIAR